MTATPPNGRTLGSLGQQLQNLLPEKVGVYVLVRYSDSLPLKEVWRGEHTKTGVAGDGKRLLGVCCQRQRAVLIHDTAKDTLMSGIKVRNFASALCVPVFTEDKSLLGTILVLSHEAGNLTKEHRYAVERMARDLRAPLESAISLPKREKEKASGTLSWVSEPFALSAMACVLLFFTVWLAAPSTKDSAEQTVLVVEPLKSLAKERAAEFLLSLQEGNYNRAYGYLGPTLRSEWSQSDFTERMSDWVETDARGEKLKNRQISRIQRHHKSAQITLLESAIDGDQGHWNWSLEEVRGDWWVTRMNGPIESPRS